MHTRRPLVLGALAAVVLTALSLLAVAAIGGRTEASRGPYGDSRAASCAVPNLAGAVVNVSLINSGGPMMGGAPGGGVRGGMMRLTAQPASVPHGVVSFVATNLGSVNHELVILPLAAAEIPGTRQPGPDNTVDESASLGEASNTCGAGTGDGIAPASSGWTTVTLTPGRYELVCNLPGHYAAGMYTQITVR